MAFGFPAYAEAVELFEDCSRDDLLDAVDDVLEALSWDADYTDQSSLSTAVGVSCWSLGERLTIKVSEGIVRVRSQCARRTQCFDSGKNQRNVEQFVRRLKTIVYRKERARRRRENPHELAIHPDCPSAPPAPSSADPQSRPRDDADNKRSDFTTIRPAGPGG